MMGNLSNKTISERVKYIENQIYDCAISCGRNPEDIKLMGITKTRTCDEVNQAIKAGVKLLGENKAQELVQRYNLYDKDDIEIHFVGHLQTNKVHQIIDKVTMIHSVDSIKLAEEINKQSEKINKIMKILIEINIGNEINKSGIYANDAINMIKMLSQYRNVQVCGLMAIPPIGTEIECEKYFYNMEKLFVDICGKKIDNVYIDELSMGMSSDYTMAIKHGSTIVRIGTAMFGERNYNI